METKVSKYFDDLHAALSQTEVTLPIEDQYDKIVRLLKGDRNIFFIGNGGSASIASHMAIDYTKNGGFKALAFNDVSAITCLANDFSFEEVFSKQIEKWADAKDIVFAISSSGKSPNILKGVEAANAKGCYVITLSSFSPDNPLRKMGDINFYVPATEYGFAEIAHLTILHSILDMSMGLLR